MKIAVLKISQRYRSLKSRLRRRLVALALRVYQRWLKHIPWGKAIGHAVLRHGYVDPREIEPSAPSYGRIMSVDDCDSTQSQSDLENFPGFHLSPPLNFQLSDSLVLQPHLNIIIPSLSLKHMSGGPNTALLFGAYLADGGESVRIISCDAPSDRPELTLYNHMEELFLKPINRNRVVLVDGFDRSKAINIGANDLFMATAWWTAQIVKYALQKTVHDKFFYLIQDYEPILHPASTMQARAVETYSFPHIPIINTRLLLKHLIKEGTGCYARSEFVDKALYFEPAIDRTKFFPSVSRSADVHKRHTLLFYARPNSHRNLFEIGVIALRHAVASGRISKDNWEVFAMGEKVERIDLGNGVVLNPLQWLSLDEYANRIRNADLLLSLMLSPHPSYPPLEMAASGKLVVTNSCSVKTPQQLSTISPNILTAEPTVDSIVSTLNHAVARINAGLPSYDPAGRIDLPSTWDEGLATVVQGVRDRIAEQRRLSFHHGKTVTDGWPRSPLSDYERFRKDRLLERRRAGRWMQTPGLLSFVTSAYNTDPKFLTALASSLFLQDGGTGFEWVLLDNGSTKQETRECLRNISRHPCVRFERVETNRGIIGGMRHCLEQATGRYILPLDSDDVVEPDCVHVLTRFIVDAGFPTLLYTDEDKLSDDHFVMPYFKSDWDPVLFLHSCFIAHLCAMDREKALALELYTEPRAEGCHDWDSFIRFMNAGHVPTHIPEVLYSWRMHQQSTAGNIDSKGYISDSHRSVLQHYLDIKKVPHIELVKSPLFQFNVDWWFKRERSNPVSHAAVHIERASDASWTITCNSEELRLDSKDGLSHFARMVKRLNTELVSIRWGDVKAEDDEWLWEAMGLIELFPDTVMVGGVLHDGSKVIDGPRLFGFGRGCDCPDRGRSISDPGYSAYMWKQRSVSAVSSGHCVIKKHFLEEALAEIISNRAGLEMLGPWLGGLAREGRKRVVYTPFMRSNARFVPEEMANQHDWSHFLSRFWHLLPEERLVSPRLGLDENSAYIPVSDSVREKHVRVLQSKLLKYDEWLSLEIGRRINQYPVPAHAAKLSLLTTVYEKTSFAYLTELARSINAQTLPPAQWIIVAHGPIAGDLLEQIIGNAIASWNATVIVEPNSLGIMAAMRRGLESVEGDYVVPVDADDLLTRDAVQILTHGINHADRPDLLYSDEDMLVYERPALPYLRSEFDPVLNLESSYIWHLCAIRKDSAEKFGLYSDPQANWCHDWDTVSRIATGGGRMSHVPEVLYHWRQHPGSTTNKPAGDSRSLESTRRILERQIASTRFPERFVVENWPVSRGAAELYIARRTDYLPPFVWIGDCKSSDLYQDSKEDSILIVMTDDLSIDPHVAFNEAARLFDLHPNIGAVGGRVVDRNENVVEGCLVINERGEMESPWAGHNFMDTGPYGLAAKAQTVASTGPSLGFFRVQAIKCLADPKLEIPFGKVSLQSWVVSVCRRLRDAGWQVAFTPLISAGADKFTGSQFAYRQGSRKSDSVRPHALARYGNLCAYDFRFVSH